MNASDIDCKVTVPPSARGELQQASSAVATVAFLSSHQAKCTDTTPELKHELVTLIQVMQRRAARAQAIEWVKAGGPPVRYSGHGIQVEYNTAHDHNRSGLGLPPVVFLYITDEGLPDNHVELPAHCFVLDAS